MNKTKMIALALSIVMAMGLLIACQNAEADKEPEKEPIVPEVAEKLELCRQDLRTAYTELDSQYELYRDAGQLEEWKSFSSDWLVATKNIRHDISEEDIDKQVTGKINVLENIKEIMFDIWEGYNEDMNGRAMDSTKMGQDKKVLETLLDKLEY